MCCLDFFQNRILKKKATFQKCTPSCVLLKASILNSSIIFLCVVDTVTTPLRLGACVISMYRSVTCVSAHWRCFSVRYGYAGDSVRPRELLMHTGRKPGKSWSWVDTSLSLVPR